MTFIKPFYALRPDPAKAGLVSSPPYDVVDTEEARHMAKDNPFSFLHVIRSEIDLPQGTDPYTDVVYQKASENLDFFIREGILIKDKEPSLFVYTQQMGGHFQTGIVACCKVEQYDADLIKKHEKTRTEKEMDRTRHILATNAHTEPVFLMYQDVEVINAMVEDSCRAEPLYSFTAPDGINHIVHRILGSSCMETLIRQFESIDHLFISDGHHRSAASSRACEEKRKTNLHHTGQEEYNYFLAVLFPASSLKILPYNRIVKDVRGLSWKDLCTQISKHFKISETTNPVPGMKGQFGMYFDNKWYMLTEKPWEHKIDDPVMKLDANLLQEYILHPILGIGDPRTDKRITFVGGIHGHQELKRKVDGRDGEIAFLLHPVLVEDIMKVSDAGKTMPPKSTWFEPKLRSGIFIHSL
jgi:uncharacterized protein (DUF1015 family)